MSRSGIFPASSSGHLNVESARYDETAPSNTLRELLETEQGAVRGGSLTVRIPPLHALPSAAHLESKAMKLASMKRPSAVESNPSSAVLG